MPIPPLALAAGISGVSGAGSNILQNVGSRRAAKFAANHNLHMWNLQNEYNHPSAQMARLRKAGLNPNLIYGTSPSSAVGSAGNVAPMKAPEYKFENPLKEINTFTDAKQKEAQTDNLREQNNVLKQESILKAAQVGDIGAKTARTKFDLNLAKELRQTSLDASRENLRQMELTSVGKDLDNRFKDQSLKNRVKDINYRVKNAVEELKGKELLNQLRSLEVELKQIGIERNDPWYFRIIGRHLDEVQQIMKN